jgi:hypothetical protein
MVDHPAIDPKQETEMKVLRTPAQNFDDLPDCPIRGEA